jgi:hypothetical protein
VLPEAAKTIGAALRNQYVLDATQKWSTFRRYASV